ncbi:MAG TPA: hypothetical protein ENJ82_01200 [Bacteroidetes bacterium]|nr:hypothetical protein [Bacteroidota bacterium]
MSKLVLPGACLGVCTRFTSCAGEPQTAPLSEKQSTWTGNEIIGGGTNWASQYHFGFKCTTLS